MRKWIALVLAGVVLFAGGFGLGYYYAGLNEPVRSVVESDSVTEVYEEFPVSKLTTIRLTLKNENVRVRLSDNQYVRLVYQPSEDGLTFHYYYDQNTLVLTVGEVNESSGIIPGNREMIYLYLPRYSAKDLSVTTDKGFVDIDGVSLGNLTITTTSGDVTITDSNLVSKTSVSSESGSVYFRNTDFREAAFFSKSGSLNVAHILEPSECETIVKGKNLFINGLPEESRTISAVGFRKKFYVETETGVIRLKVPYEPETVPEETPDDIPGGEETTQS